MVPVAVEGVPGQRQSGHLRVTDADAGRVGVGVERGVHACYRTLDELRENHNTEKKDFLYGPDRREQAKFADALNDPRNREMRGVETVTNNQESVAYWRVMMAAYGVKGYARYEP